jgi:4,5-DOPA dioxygenase extradiol
MFPHADIPVVQLSLNRDHAPADHYAMGKELLPLREEGILILGSGNIVHNLQLIQWDGGAYDWATAFDKKVAGLIANRNHDGILNLLRGDPGLKAAVPTTEHFVPLLYCLALQQPEDQLTFFAEDVVMGSLSMRSLIIRDVHL